MSIIKRIKKNRDRLIEFGIYLLVCLLLSILFFLIVRIVCLEQLEESLYMRYEAEQCVLEQEKVKENCQETLSKSGDLQEAIWIISQKEYDFDNHNCLHFSKDLQAKLKEVEIKSSIIQGKWGGNDHYWIAVWIEPTEGRFIKTDEDYVMEENSVQFVFLNTE